MDDGAECGRASCTALIRGSDGERQLVKISSLRTAAIIGASLLAASAEARSTTLPSSTPAVPSETRFVEDTLQRHMMFADSVQFKAASQTTPCDGVVYVSVTLREQNFYGGMGPYRDFVVAVTHQKSIFYDPGPTLTYYEIDSVGLVDDGKRKAYADCGGAPPLPPVGRKADG